MSNELIKIEMVDLKLKDEVGNTVVETSLPIEYLKDVKELSIESVLAMQIKFENSPEYKYVKNE